MFQMDLGIGSRHQISSLREFFRFLNLHAVARDKIGLCLPLSQARQVSSVLT